MKFNKRKVSRKERSLEADLFRRIEEKVSDIDIKGAVKLLTSNDKLAIADENTLSELKKKHPEPSRDLIFPENPKK